MGEANNSLDVGPGLPPLQRPAPSGMPSWLLGLLAVVTLYVFVGSVGMIGSGLKVIAKDEAGRRGLDYLFGMVNDPFSGLLVGLLTTSLVQSSSFTTSMLVALVAAGDVSLQAAIPMVMGANIGTSVTNSLVALGHVRQRRQFRRSLAGATVHDFFNILSVLVLLPLELTLGVISRPVGALSAWLGDTQLFQSDPTEKAGALKAFFSLPAAGAKWVSVELAGLSPVLGGALVSIAGVLALFLALAVLVRLLKNLMSGRLSSAFDQTIFRTGAIAFVFGMVVTAAVQSSSVTTSLVVPLVAARIVKLRQAYPYTLGANLGTTFTAMLAALGTGSAPAVACAAGHMLFNILGIAVFWPLQFIPISLAKGLARLAFRRRVLAVIFLVGVFFGLPAAGLVLAQLLR